MKTTIYCLRDPSEEVRYIGKTINRLDSRLRCHLSEARSGRANYRCRWIRKLLSRNMVPSIHAIAVVEGDGNKEEISWIAYYKSVGARLVNTTIGGEGVTNPPIAVRNRIRLAQLGKKPSSSHRRNQSIAQKKRFLRDNSIEFRGEFNTAFGWSKVFGISRTMFYKRLEEGESIESIFLNKRRKVGCPPGQSPPNKLPNVLPALAGVKFGKLTVFDGTVNRISGRPYIFTVCDCGNQSWKSYSCLIARKCGCRRCGSPKHKFPDGKHQMLLV